MKNVDVFCMLCGHKLDANACQSCPMGSNCPIVCCPQCGFTSIDTSKSRLANLAKDLLGSINPLENPNLQMTLDQVPNGSAAWVVSIESGELTRLLQLQAFGLAPGRQIQVLQQEPVTIIRADNTELALENDLASRVIVEVDSL